MLALAVVCRAVARTPDGGIEVTVSDADAARRAIPAMVASRHLALRRMDAGEVDLEAVFVELVGGSGT